MVKKIVEHGTFRLPVPCYPLHTIGPDDVDKTGEIRITRYSEHSGTPATRGACVLPGATLSCRTEASLLPFPHGLTPKSLEDAVQRAAETPLAIRKTAGERLQAMAEAEKLGKGR